MVTLQDAKEVTNIIVRRLRPLSVVLFGSVARDNIGEDLDLLVIMEDGSETTNTLNMRLTRSLRGFYRKFDIDPFIVQRSTLSEHYRKGSHFLRLLSREGRSLYMKDAIREWLRQAEEELDTAGYLARGGFFRGACYHAQQAIEKAVKVRLFEKGWELEKTHSMERLAAIGKEYKIRIDMNEDEMVFIDNIYRGRYPIETGLLPLGEPAREDAEKAVNIASRMVKSTGNVQKGKNK